MIPHMAESATNRDLETLIVEAIEKNRIQMQMVEIEKLKAAVASSTNEALKNRNWPDVRAE